jgi:hypothetical protein
MNSTITQGIKSGILSLILEVELKRNLHSVNLFVVDPETVVDIGYTCYHVGFSTGFQPLSGRMYRNEYRAQDGKIVFVREVSRRMS